MDHHEQHRQQHQKEREHKIEHERAVERKEAALPRRIHPAWFVIVGAALIVAIVLGWTFYF